MRPITLEYHDVLDVGDFDQSGFPGGAANSYKMSRADFEAHLDVLRGRPEAGVDVRLTDAARTPVFITFDDGGASALGVSAPALEARGLMGHFFMTTSQLGAPTFCDGDALRELVRRGHVVGSHSHTHPVRMAVLTDAELDQEWHTSYQLLSDLLGAPATVASVPGGYYSARVGRAAARAGIRYLFTSEPVTSVAREAECLVLGRYTLRRTSPASEVASLVSRAGFARHRQWAVWNAKKAVKAVAGETYLRVRASILGDTSPAPPSTPR
ncbi:MAG: polysaccharide deacetylase family protein [Gemmatimonadaceae bacterium]|nr:polysaccharide deacetylase family protein [Gemmatimonadaceae bacterium]